MPYQFNPLKGLRGKKESSLLKQIGRSGTSIGANIREAQQAHGKADFIAKLQIALKEANETGYRPESLYKTGYIDEDTYKELNSDHRHPCYAHFFHRHRQSESGNTAINRDLKGKSYGRARYDCE